MIDELMLVVNKDAEINIVMNTGDYQTEYIPDLYDFSVIDFTDVHPDDGNSENKVVIGYHSSRQLQDWGLILYSATVQESLT